MAERPVFVPNDNGRCLVSEIPVSFRWHSGMAPVQKKKNVRELHDAANRRGLTNILEISTKSDREIGRRLSAFHQKIKMKDGTFVPLESAYQSSKVFEKNGPFLDLLKAEPRDAKRDVRLRESGNLIRFEFDGDEFPLYPKSVFYDWLYANAIFSEREWLKKLEYLDGFTDIEFNPEKSVNCQARSCAFYVALSKRHVLDDAMLSFFNFAKYQKDYTL